MTIINGYVPPFKPLSNITPFTYRDGMTYLSILEDLRKFVNTDLIDFINTNFTGLGDTFELEVNKLITDINIALAAQDLSFDNKIAEFETFVSETTALIDSTLATQNDYVNTQVANLTTYVNEQIALVINGSIEVNEAIVNGVISDEASSARVTLDANYADKTIETLVNAGRLSEANLDIAYAEKAIESVANAASNVINSGRLTELALNEDYRFFLKASDYGVIGDGVADDTTALYDLLQAASTLGLTARLAPNSTVFVNDKIVFPSNVRFDLNGSTILRGSANGAVTFELLNQSNIEIFNGKINGNKSAYASATEWRHNVNLDNSHNVYIHDFESNFSKGDGIYVGGTVAHCTNIRLDNVICNGNHRQGLSIIGVDFFTANSCKFINTSGTAPQSGVDVEPNLDTQVCTNIKFINCVMSGNTGHGYLEALRTTRTAVQGGVTLIGCTLEDNLEAGVRLTESSDFQMIGGYLNNNLYGVWHNTNVMRKAKFTNVTAFRNKGHGVAVSAPFSDFAIIGCTFDSNGQTQIGDGLNIAPSSASSGLKFIGNYSGQSPQRNGLTLGANAVASIVVGNSYGGNSGVERSGTSAIATDIEPAAKRTVSGAKGGNAALTSLITQLAGLGLITDSTT